MASLLSFYGKFLGLLIVICLMVGFNFITQGFHRQARPTVWHIAGARPERGAALSKAYGCSACHTMPDSTEMPRSVGPSLERVKDQLFIAGVLPNTPENLRRWIQDPKQFRPRTAMPNLRVGPDDARDIAAYLYAPQ